MLPLVAPRKFLTTHFMTIDIQVRSAAADQFNRLCKDVSVLGGVQCYCNIIVC